jgi:hypothetical protein
MNTLSKITLSPLAYSARGLNLVNSKERGNPEGTEKGKKQPFSVPSRSSFFFFDEQWQVATV